MERLQSKPAKDGFRMPGEFEPHKGTVLVWPVRPGSWTNHGREAQEVFAGIARAIAESEDVYLCVGREQYAQVSHAFEKDERIHVLELETDDAWARDIGPTFVRNAQTGEVRGIDWKFNAWGGGYDGLYADYEKDDAAAGSLCELLGYDCYDAKSFVLEGGSIHSDGEGTVLVTETCLLSPGRNPKLTKEQIESQLCAYLGAEKILWLPRGIDGDETNEHVDNICAFVRPGEVVLAWTDKETDPQWKASQACYEMLQQCTDAKGRKLNIHKLPIPDRPVCITQEELDALEFEPGEAEREAGERLAASYVNFYISNGGILLPQFGDEQDAQAVGLMESLFPERKVYPVFARPIIVGGGNIHCITQQIPL